MSGKTQVLDLLLAAHAISHESPELLIVVLEVEQFLAELEKVSLMILEFIVEHGNKLRLVQAIQTFNEVITVQLTVHLEGIHQVSDFLSVKTMDSLFHLSLPEIDAVK